MSLLPAECPQSTALENQLAIGEQTAGRLMNIDQDYEDNCHNSISR